MTFKAGVATSTHPSPVRAAEEVISRAKASAGISRPDLVILYATAAYNQEALVKAVSAAAPGAALVGCSCEGIISQAGSNEDKFAAMATVIESGSLRFQVAAAAGLAQDSGAAGRAAAEPRCDGAAASWNSKSSRNICSRCSSRPIISGWTRVSNRTFAPSNPICGE